MTWNGFRGAAVRLDDLDLPRIGARIGVGEDEIHAFMDVEAAGSGFDTAGRPKMLFEPHVFYRNLTGAARAQAEVKGLAYRVWKRGAYPADSYPRLEQAIAIDETAALKAASWGLGQVLGENFAAASFDSPQAMVRAMMGGEAAQLEASIAFIEANGLDDELRRHDWSAFARGYNGPGYATHGYHTKLAAAYARWANIPDTKWTPGVQTPPEVPPMTGEPPAPAVPAPDATPIGKALTVTGKGLRLRAWPVEGDVLASLMPGQGLELVSTWHQVRGVVDGCERKGWVAGDFVRAA